MNILVSLAAAVALFLITIVALSVSFFRRGRVYCPDCGHKTALVTRHPTQCADQFQIGRGLETVTCKSCGYSHTDTYVIPRVTDDVTDRIAPADEFTGINPSESANND